MYSESYSGKLSVVVGDLAANDKVFQLSVVCIFEKCAARGVVCAFKNR